jgi:hypothetical protein
MNIHGCDLADFTSADKMKDVLFPATDAMKLPEKLTSEIEVILLLDVVEHIERPEEFLELIKTRFKSLRYILFTVPAGPELWSNYDEFNGHFRRYSLDSLIALPLPDGFTGIAMQYLFRILYLPAIAQVKFINHRNTKINPPSGFSRVIHRLVSSLLFIDYASIPAKWKGTSLIMLAHKS